MSPLGPITHLTVHCAATPEGRPVTAVQLSEWDTAKFGQVSYHFVVELDGKLVTTLSTTFKGAHTGGHNTGNVGVCYVGGVDAKGNPKDTRTEAQKKTLRDIVDHFRKLAPGIIVQGHRDWPDVHKACPSFDVRTQL